MVHNCNLCNKNFPSKSQLERHKNNKTSCIQPKESTDCKICNIKFQCIAKLERHKLSNKHIINNKPVNETIPVEKESKLKEELQEAFNIKLTNELKVKEDEISKLTTNINSLTKENNNLKFDFTDAIKSEIQNEVLELIPIFDKMTTYKGLNKINMNEILTQYNKLLSITDLLYIINYDLNKLYIDKFWNNIESEDWIYLDEELIQWFGYKESKEAKRILINFIKQSDDDEYKILNNEEYQKSLVCAAHTRIFDHKYKHIFVSSDCFKKTCFKVGTKKSEEIISYFIEVEKIFKFYNKYILEYKNYELEKSKLIKNRYINKSNLLINSKLYLITNNFKAKENIFKFGSTINEKTRKSTYNTCHVEADEFFYVAIYDCYDAISLEKRIAKLLINFKIPNESEMYQLHFNALDNIIKLAIKNDMDTLESVNVFLTEEYDKYLNLEHVKF